MPALEAAHIRPYSKGGEHEPQNGLLIRRDIHSLFDTGYVTVTPDQREVHRQIFEGDETLPTLSRTRTSGSASLWCPTAYLYPRFAMLLRRSFDRH